MDANARLINQLLDALPYPMSKDAFIEKIRATGADNVTLARLESLSNSTFNCAREVRDQLAKLESQATK